MTVIECEKEMMVFQWCTKFVAELNLGRYSLGAEGSRTYARTRLSVCGHNRKYNMLARLG